MTRPMIKIFRQDGEPVDYRRYLAELARIDDELNAKYGEISWDNVNARHQHIVEQHQPRLLHEFPNWFEAELPLTLEEWRLLLDLTGPFTLCYENDQLTAYMLTNEYSPNRVR